MPPYWRTWKVALALLCGFLIEVQSREPLRMFCVEVYLENHRFLLPLYYQIHCVSLVQVYSRHALHGVTIKPNAVNVKKCIFLIYALSHKGACLLDTLPTQLGAFVHSAAALRFRCQVPKGSIFSTCPSKSTSGWKHSITRSLWIDPNTSTVWILPSSRIQSSLYFSSPHAPRQTSMLQLF